MRKSNCCNARIIHNNGCKKNVQERSQRCSKCGKDASLPTSAFLPPPAALPHSFRSIPNEEILKDRCSQYEFIKFGK